MSLTYYFLMTFWSSQS